MMRSHPSAPPRRGGGLQIGLCHNVKKTILSIMLTYIRVLCVVSLCLGLSACGQLLETSKTYTYETVYVVNSDGSNGLQLSPELTYNYGQADWSPDNTQLVYASYDLGELFVSPATGGTATNITQSSDVAEHSPKWSPAGAYIAYYVRSGSQNNLYVRLADGTLPQMILENVSRFAWSPDDAYLAAVSAGKLYLVSVAGVNQGVLVQDIDTSKSLEWLSATVLRYDDAGTSYGVTTSGASFSLLDTTNGNWRLPTRQLATQASSEAYYSVSTTGNVQQVLSHGTYAALSDDAGALVSVYQQSVYRHAADGSATALLFSATGGSLGNPVLKGSQILFVSGTGIYSGAIAAGSVSQIATGIAASLSPNGAKVSYVGFRRVSE